MWRFAAFQVQHVLDSCLETSQGFSRSHFVLSGHGRCCRSLNAPQNLSQVLCGSSRLWMCGIKWSRAAGVQSSFSGEITEYHDTCFLIMQHHESLDMERGLGVEEGETSGVKSLSSLMLPHIWFWSVYLWCVSPLIPSPLPLCKQWNSSAVDPFSFHYISSPWPDRYTEPESTLPVTVKQTPNPSSLPPQSFEVSSFLTPSSVISFMWRITYWWKQAKAT